MAKVDGVKGHTQSLATFAAGLRSGRRHDAQPAITTTHLALRALQSLHEGRSVPLGLDMSPVVDLTA